MPSPFETTSSDFSDLGPTCSVDDAARILGIGRATAYRATQTGELPCLRFGRRIVISTTALQLLLTDGHALSPSERETSPE